MNPLVTIDEIRQASQTILGRVHRTPIHTSRTIGEMLNIDLAFKMELFQKTGSFKPRGVLNKLNSLSLDEKAKGVISLSAGNHAQALSWGASSENIPSTIVMPAKADQTKIKATKSYGGEVILTEGDLLEVCLTIQKERDLTLIHPFDDLKVIAGQGTVGLEILEDVEDLDTLVVSIGGGGLMSGVAVAVKQSRPDVRIIGVEPETSNVMTQSLAAGHSVTLETGNTIADGLDAPFAGVHTLHHIDTYVDEMINVTEDEIVASIRLIMQRAKVVPEPAAGAALAALLSGKVSCQPHEKVVVVLCGGNINLQVLRGML